MRNIILLLITLSLSLMLGGCSGDTTVSPAPPPTLTGDYAGIYKIETTHEVIEMYTFWRFSSYSFLMRCVDTLDYHCISCRDFDGSYSLNEGVNLEVSPQFEPCNYEFAPDGHFDYKQVLNRLTLTQYNEERQITKTVTLKKVK